MFRSILSLGFLRPLQMRKLFMYLPQFARVFYRLMNDSRVGILPKLVPVMALLVLLTPPALELDMIPIVGELDWMLVAFVAFKIFIWLCPPDIVREHVTAIARNA
ncbi:MAG TPA: hypothetical protein VMA09_12380 [Candidatus Binataceae bacterium]|nr:hypothetical protein [Candidatus Binataceae bacterium]